MRHLGRHLHDRHHVAEADGEADQHHHHRHRLDHAVHELRQVAPLVVAVDEDGDEERVHAGHRRRLGGGEHARQDAAEDDERSSPGPRARRARSSALACSGTGSADRETRACATVQSTRPMRQTPNSRPGRMPARNSARDRDRAAGGERVDHRVVRRRDQERLHRAADRHVGGEHARSSPASPSAGSSPSRSTRYRRPTSPRCSRRACSASTLTSARPPRMKPTNTLARLTRRVRHRRPRP